LADKPHLRRVRHPGRRGDEHVDLLVGGEDAIDQCLRTRRDKHLLGIELDAVGLGVKGGHTPAQFRQPLDCGVVLRAGVRAQGLRRGLQGRKRRLAEAELEDLTPAGLEAARLLVEQQRLGLLDLAKSIVPHRRSVAVEKGRILWSGSLTRRRTNIRPADATYITMFQLRPTRRQPTSPSLEAPLRSRQSPRCGVGVDSPSALQ
jgi:hypothetical protein